MVIDGLHFLKHGFHIFFLLEQKETKIQGKTNFNLFFAQKSHRIAAKKIAVRSLSPKAAAPLPTYEKCKPSAFEK